MASVKLRNSDHLPSISNQQDVCVEETFSWKADSLQTETINGSSSSSRLSLSDDEKDDRLTIDCFYDNPSSVTNNDNFDNVLQSRGTPSPDVRRLTLPNEESLNTPLFAGLHNTEKTNNADSGQTGAEITSNHKCADPVTVVASQTTSLPKLIGASRRKARFCQRAKVRQLGQRENENSGDNGLNDRWKSAITRPRDDINLENVNYPGASDRLPISAQEKLALLKEDSVLPKTVNGARHTLSSIFESSKCEFNSCSSVPANSSVRDEQNLVYSASSSAPPPNRSHAQVLCSNKTSVSLTAPSTNKLCSSGKPFESINECIRNIVSSATIIPVNNKKRPASNNSTDIPQESMDLPTESVNLNGSDGSSCISDDQDELSSSEKRLDLSWINSKAEIEEPVALEELEKFSKTFKRKRIKLGFTQGDVGLAMGKLYGTDFSQTTISRFEALNLSFKNMCKLKPLLEKWLIDTEVAVQRGTFESQILKAQGSNEINNVKRRKKRTSIEGTLRLTLEEIFMANSRPTVEQLGILSKELSMEREVVRVWFCNRRQKERRIQTNDSPSTASNISPPNQPATPTPPAPNAVLLLLAMNAAAAAAAAAASSAPSSPAAAVTAKNK